MRVVDECACEKGALVLDGRKMPWEIIGFAVEVVFAEDLVGLGDLGGFFETCIFERESDVFEDGESFDES